MACFDATAPGDSPQCVGPTGVEFFVRTHAGDERANLVLVAISLHMKHIKTNTKSDSISGRGVTGWD